MHQQEPIAVRPRLSHAILNNYSILQQTWPQPHLPTTCIDYCQFILLSCIESQ